MFKLFLLLILIIVVFSQVTPFCTSDASCNNIETTDSKYCATATGTCTAKATIALKTNKPNPKNQYACTDGFESGQRCVALANENCQISQVESVNYVCVPGEYDSGSTSCKTAPSTDKISSLNGRCDETTTPKTKCPLGTTCNNSVCRALAPVGAFCSENKNCITNLCDHRKCVIARSLSDLSLCENPGSCKSGFCISGVCGVFSGNPCYENSQCTPPFYPAYNEKCKLPANSNSDSVGKCYGKYSQTQYEYYSCVYNKCQSIYGTTLSECINSNCTKEYVNDVCAFNCRLHPEQRYSKSYGAFTYDCTAIKRTAWVATDCEKKQDGQIMGCTGQDF